VATVHAGTLRRAAEICCGEERLAAWLRVTPSQLSRWIDGLSQPPTSAFLHAVDLVVDHSMSHLPIKPPAALVGSETLSGPLQKHPPNLLKLPQRRALGASGFATYAADLLAYRELEAILGDMAIHG
jgi:hypothetical protein